LNNDLFLLDTHALIFWVNQTMSQALSQFLDEEDTAKHLMVSSVSFWEIGLLVRKKKLQIDDVLTWKSQVFENTNIKLIVPSIDEFIHSTELPLHHKDPFDRVLITQANFHSAKLVTKDKAIKQYDIKTFWID